MDEGIKCDGPFINLIMTHILSKEEMLLCTATGKKGKGDVQRKQLDVIKRNFIKGNKKIY
jgi:hypothetical protein